MNRLITRCPNCHENLKIASLKCPECGLELRNDFEPSAFDRITDDQYAFLVSFLKNRGNMKNVQSEMQLSYPSAKKKLDDLLHSLGIYEEESDEGSLEKIDMSHMVINHDSTKASEIIKAKLKEAGGRVVVHTARGLPCEVIADSDGRSFVSDKLPIKPAYRYEVFDTIVDLLLANEGRARKGNGRNYRLGHPECDETTVVGAIAINYSGKHTGDSVYDPVFVLAAILEWAGLITNGRGEIALTAAYRSKL